MSSKSNPLAGRKAVQEKKPSAAAQSQLDERNKQSEARTPSHHVAVENRHGASNTVYNESLHGRTAVQEKKPSAAAQATMELRNNMGNAPRPNRGGKKSKRRRSRSRRRKSRKHSKKGGRRRSKRRSRRRSRRSSKRRSRRR